jgi:hypothetical protein
MLIANFVGRLLKLAAFIGLLVSMVVFAQAAGVSNAQTENDLGDAVWDLADTDQRGQFTFYDATAGASQTGKPLEAGDFNGDGCGDLVLAASNATIRTETSGRRNAGHVRIVMDICTIAGMINMADEPPHDYAVMTIWGAQSGDMAGTEVFVADFNGDDYDDLLLGAQNNDGAVGARRDAGAAYLILGGEDFAQTDIIDLANPPSNVFTFYGASPQDRFGLWVDGGDFDGDGYADLLIGANQADGENNERINTGEAWIVFGSSDLTSLYEAQTDMSMPPSSATRIIGVDYDDLFGSTTLGADVDGDGFDDALISAALWRESAGIGGLELGGGDGVDNQRYNSGETFVIYGHSQLRGSVIDLAQLLVDGVPNSEAISVIYGADANDLLGEELAVGDFNGDGVSEIALGSLIANGADNAAFEAGEAWIISAHPPFRGRAFDVLSLEPERGFVIYPDQADSMGGDILRFADLNDDGYDELLYGAPTFDYEDEEASREDTGILAVFWGGKHISRMFDQQLIMPSNLPAAITVNYLVGVDSDDETVYGLAVYDFDQDGYLDIAPNAMLGDGADNRLQNAGDAYIVSGLLFQQRFRPFRR